MRYPQNPFGMLFMQLLRKRTRELKPLLALDFIFGMSADPANNIILAVWEKACLAEGFLADVCIFLIGAIKQENIM